MTPAAPRRRGHVSWLKLTVQLGAFVVILGIPDGILGVLWPSMRSTFHLPLDDLGALTIASAVLYFAGGLIAVRVRARLGAPDAMVASCAVALVGLVVWSGTPSWLLLLGAVAVLGGSRGVIDAVVNAEAALEGGVRRLGLLHGSWAIGGTLGPLLVAAVLVWAHDWRVAVVVVAAAVLVITGVALVDRQRSGATEPAPEPSVGPWVPASLVPAESPERQGEPAGAAGQAVAPADAAARPRLRLMLTLAAFVTYTAAESGPIAWGYTYLIYDRHSSRTLAAVGIACYWAALMAGRFGLAAVDDRVAGPVILEASCILMMVGTALFWLLPGSLSIVGLPVAGLGAAAVFPVLVALMPARLGTAATGHAVGLSIAAASIAGPTAVAAFGVLAAHLGVGALGACLFGITPVLYIANRTLSTATAGGTA
ncbi:MAG TPA: MFS transporter [Acidimicrobiales bacterium]|nr:MFS transporter [Acidimicrobiales bacterium]